MRRATKPQRLAFRIIIAKMILSIMNVHSLSHCSRATSILRTTGTSSTNVCSLHRDRRLHDAIGKRFLTRSWLVPSLRMVYTTTFPSRGRIRRREIVSSMESKITTDQSATATEQQSDAESVWQEDDTIYALSTGNIGAQATALAVIRISGPQAHDMLELLLAKPNNNEANGPSNVGSRLPPPRKAVVRSLYDPISRSPLDQALILRFDAPHSFTGEDVVELHCHGSRAVLQGILEALSKLSSSSSSSLSTTTISSRLAEPGEFTQRAMLNGKLDLLQVEALADLLAADTQRQRQQALQQLQPGDNQLSRLYSSWRSTLISGLAHAEAVIDFGDDEHLDADDDGFDLNSNSNKGQWNVWGNVATKMHQLWTDMQQHLADGRRGELVRTGIKVAIVGPPNAGKSSLFNLLAQRDAAIVSPQAGTTRDVLELTLDLGGVKCLLSDTAGLRDTTLDMIEQEGMKRARNVAQQADIVLAVVDMTNPKEGLQALQDAIQPTGEKVNEDDGNEAVGVVSYDDEPDNNQVAMLVLNKMDLSQAPTIPNDFQTPWSDTFSFAETCAISCETNQGVDIFLESLTNLVLARVSGDDNNTNKSAINKSLHNEGAMISRARHRQHVEAAAEALSRFRTLSQQGSMAVDLAAEELRLAASELGRITGAVDVEDVLDVLFRDFCIGK